MRRKSKNDWQNLSSDECLKIIFQTRYPDVQCPKCHRKNSYYRSFGKQCFTCSCGQSHIYPCKGTLFERSRIPLSKWCLALHLMLQAPGGVSTKEIERRLKISYASAWRMVRKIQSAIPKHQMQGISSCEQFLKTFSSRKGK